ncbi:hypothetical protein [Arthrobacter sp. OAP107]|uniref:hypothetical protein n=1 Tax=Arthrobacter sp. OAP107 TaxID=3156445 RepID=UPI003393C7B1
MLVEHVVGIDQEVPGLTHLDGSAMSGWQRMQLGHPEFNDEAPARCKVAGNILEAADLFFLGKEVGDGVEHKECKGEIVARPQKNPASQRPSGATAPSAASEPRTTSHAFLFCASDLSTIMTGSTLLADAGQTI